MSCCCSLFEGNQIETVLFTKNFIKQYRNIRQILIVNVDE